MAYGPLQPFSVISGTAKSAGIPVDGLENITVVLRGLSAGTVGIEVSYETDTDAEYVALTNRTASDTVALWGCPKFVRLNLTAVTMTAGGLRGFNPATS